MPAFINLETLELNDLRKPQGHKYDHGHALVLSGGAGRTGAARLAARGALRIGAGAVTLGVPPNAQMEVAMQITAIMHSRIDSAESLRETLKDPRINVVCLGPALGVNDHARALVECVLADGRPCVLDADALTLLSQDQALFAALHERCVLTPHEGEFARLFPDIAEQRKSTPGFSKEAATQAAAARAGAVVILKGADTWVADPKGRCHHHAAAGKAAVPWLATAGAGDVLAGFITGLIARGLAPVEAAKWSVFLHTGCAQSFGPGLIAEDLPEELPEVFRQLGI